MVAAEGGQSEYVCVGVSVFVPVNHLASDFSARMNFVQPHCYVFY